MLAEGSDPVSSISKEVGGRGNLHTCYSKNPFLPDAKIKIKTGSSSSAGACYISARLEKSGNTIYVVIGGSQYASDEKVFMVDMIE